MKLKFIAYALLLMPLLASCKLQRVEEPTYYDTTQVVDSLVINNNSVPIFPRKAALTTDTAQRFALDLPKRCTVDWDNQRVLTVIPNQPVEIVRIATGDNLPGFKVSDFEFKKLTVRDALTKLLDGTNIAVIEDEMVSDKVSGTIKSGALADAVALITRMGRAYYTYDDAARELHIMRRAKWLMKMPGDQSMTLALMDAMRGIDVRNIQVNWQDNTMVFEGNYQTEKEVNRVVADVGSRKYLVAWDIDIYRVYPRTDNPIVWMNMLPAMGEKNVRMSIPGVIGRALVTGPEINTKTLQAFLAQQANVVLISQGTMVLPNGWQSRFDIGQCSREERLETDLMIGATATYGNYAGTDKVDAKIVLRTRFGELTSFKVPSTLGDNYVIIGIPTHSFVTTPETLISPFAELVIFMSPRVVSIKPAGSGESAPLSGQALRDYLEE